MTREPERVHLTLERIRKLVPPSGGHVIYVSDDAPRCLSVRVTPAGAKSFVFRGKLKGDPIRITIGDALIWKLDEARAEARRLQTKVDSGVDPREEKREERRQREAARAAEEAARRAIEEQAHFTLRALCEAYTKVLKRAGKAKSAAATRSAFKCHVFTHPEVADKPAREVTAHQVAALVRKVWDAGKERAAGILRSYLSAAFNAAKRAPFDSALPSELIGFNIEHNPVDAIPAIAVKRGDRSLSTDELRAYLAALGSDLPDQALRLALLAGGQRMAQLLRAKVSDFNPESATLRLWDGKGKRTNPREHLLPLGPQAAALVSALVERAKTREQERAKAEGRAPEFSQLWLFSSHGRVAMTETTPGKRVTDISTSMGGKSFDLRDIRRTVETMLAGMGISKDTRAQLLSHGINGVQAAHYDRYDYFREKRAALVAWEARLEEIASGKSPAGNVVELRSA